MSSDTSSAAPPLEREYLQIWAGAASRVLEQLHGSALTSTPLPAADTPPAGPPPDSVWIGWKVAGKLAGELSFFLTPSDAVRLTQLFMQEPPDPAAPLDDSHSDALKELFRQFAGLASSSCKSKYGQEVTFELIASAKPEWAPGYQESWVFASSQLPPVQWTALLNSALVASLKSAPAPKPAAASVQSAASPAPKPSPAPGSAPKPNSPPAPALAPPAASDPAVSTNLDMLLDVELDAILRFGQRDMLLRDILELRPGSVIELNRNIAEPAELLVGGRVIARGDVVIVDGNYGLRITEIEHPRQRLGSIEA
ncbi:MAG TPA: flagellar motor switch protein FliN [Verrucomicrobiae bacterium]|nr:flagellar motor switch protein FliN [Verrucomicrobiae bacterium]